MRTTKDRQPLKERQIQAWPQLINCNRLGHQQVTRIIQQSRQTSLMYDARLGRRSSPGLLPHEHIVPHEESSSDTHPATLIPSRYVLANRHINSSVQRSPVPHWHKGITNRHQKRRLCSVPWAHTHLSEVRPDQSFNRSLDLPSCSRKALPVGHIWPFRTSGVKIRVHYIAFLTFRSKRHGIIRKPSNGTPLGPNGPSW